MKNKYTVRRILKGVVMLKDVRSYLQHAVKTLRNKNHFGFSSDKTVLNGIILGTGWGETLKLEGAIEFPLSGLCPAFGTLQDLPGHARSIVYGRVAGKEVLMLRGRVHLNESPSDPKIPIAVRLQTQILMELGVRNLIVTNAAGSLDNMVHVGDVVVIDGFVTVFAPPMPLWAGEFVSPEDTLDIKLANLALGLRGNLQGLYAGGYAMVRGPFFEGRLYDKRILRNTGAMAVGMSTLPEACIAALPQYKANVLGLSFITNSDSEKHSHGENVLRAKESGAKLGGFLTRIVEALPEQK